MSLSEEPARKLFIKQCYNLIPDNLDFSRRHKKWIIKRNRPITLRLIWVQGIIISISESPDFVTLDDGTGVAFVVSVKDAPGFGNWIRKGEYIMVIGEVLSFQPEVKIRAVKVTQLLEINAETLWILEVIDFWRFMDTS